MNAFKKSGVAYLYHTDTTGNYQMSVMKLTPHFDSSKYHLRVFHGINGYLEPGIKITGVNVHGEWYELYENIMEVISYSVPYSDIKFDIMAAIVGKAFKTAPKPPRCANKLGIFDLIDLCNAYQDMKKHCHTKIMVLAKDEKWRPMGAIDISALIDTPTHIMESKIHQYITKHRNISEFCGVNGDWIYFPVNSDGKYEIIYRGINGKYLYTLSRPSALDLCYSNMPLMHNGGHSKIQYENIIVDDAKFLFEFLKFFGEYASYGNRRFTIKARYTKPWKFERIIRYIFSRSGIEFEDKELLNSSNSLQFGAICVKHHDGTARYTIGLYKRGYYGISGPIQILRYAANNGPVFFDSMPDNGPIKGTEEFVAHQVTWLAKHLIYNPDPGYIMPAGYAINLKKEYGHTVADTLGCHPLLYAAEHEYVMNIRKEELPYNILHELY